MRKQIIASALLVALLGSGSGFAPGQEQKENNVITKFGEHKLFDGKRIVKVSEDDGKLVITVILGKKYSVNTNFPTKKGVFWLVYPRTANEFWFFHDPHLIRFEKNDQGTNSTTFAGKDVLKNAPKAVQNSLPKEVIDRLKGK